MELRATKVVDALVPNECSILPVFDSFGDGINAPGGIEVTIDGQVQYQGGDYADGIQIKHGAC